MRVSAMSFRAYISCFLRLCLTCRSIRKKSGSLHDPCTCMSGNVTPSGCMPHTRLRKGISDYQEHPNQTPRTYVGMPLEATWPRTMHASLGANFSVKGKIYQRDEKACGQTTKIHSNQATLRPRENMSEGPLRMSRMVRLKT